MAKKKREEEPRWTIEDRHLPLQVDNRGFCHYHESHACPCARPWLYDDSLWWRRPDKN